MWQKSESNHHNLKLLLTKRLQKEGDKASHKVKENIWNAYLTKDLNTEYIKNSHKTKLWRQITRLKMGGKSWKVTSQKKMYK